MIGLLGIVCWSVEGVFGGSTGSYNFIRCLDLSALDFMTGAGLGGEEPVGPGLLGIPDANNDPNTNTI